MDQRFVEHARRYWTNDRLNKVTGGKRLLLLPSDSPLLLHSMGLLNADGSMPMRSVSKYRQINHMLSLILPEIELLLKKYEELHILDGCCGNSFISLLLAWYLHEKLNVRFRLTGIDRKAAVTEASQQRADQMGWGRFVKFLSEQVDAAVWYESVPQLFGQELKSMPKPHVVIALHACDTATDDVLQLGVTLRSDLMAVAPCCQAELARGWKNLNAPSHPLIDLHQSPSLRREAAATVTDAMRMALLRGCGYDTAAVEFVPSDHTPKNRLLICRRNENFYDERQSSYNALKATTGGVGIELANRLEKFPKQIE